MLYHYFVISLLRLFLEQSYSCKNRQMCCFIWHAGNNYAIVSQSGYIWIWSGAYDQESTNHSACFDEWKSRSITMFIVVSQFLLTDERSRIQCLLLFHNFYYLTKGAAYNISLNVPQFLLTHLKVKVESNMLFSYYLFTWYPSYKGSLIHRWHGWSEGCRPTDQLQC